MSHAEHYPTHDRDSCDDEHPVNAEARGSCGCARCTALLLDQRDELLAALIAEHDALDLLLAERITMDPTFQPTKWIKWPALVAGNAAIEKAKKTQ